MNAFVKYYSIGITLRLPGMINAEGNYQNNRERNIYFNWIHRKCRYSHYVILAWKYRYLIYLTNHRI